MRVPALYDEPLVAVRDAVESTPQIGVLVGFDDDGATPLVTFRGHSGTAAVRARATLDLHAAHVGQEVLVVCVNGNSREPIVIGVLTDRAPCAVPAQSGHVEFEADGRRLVVTAAEQIVLRCGKASITLTKAGKVLVQGTYVLSRATGVNRIKGGSVQLN